VDPLPIEHNTTVTVRYTGMSNRDRITFEWIFADGTHHTAVENGLDGGTVVFNLTSVKVLHRSVNSTVCLKYSVERPGVTVPIPSQVQTVRVDTIQPADLPQPLINNIAPGDVLDLRTFVGDGLASIIKWALSAARQRVWITCRSAQMAPLDVLTASGEVITQQEAANGLRNKSVVRSWLQAVPRGHNITISCDVAYSGDIDRSKSIPLRSTNYIVENAPPILDDMTDFDNFNRNGWEPLNSGVPIQVQVSGTEFYLVAPTRYYLGCTKAFPGAGAGGYQITVRYRHATAATTNYVWLRGPGGTSQYFTTSASSSWVTQVIGPVYAGENIQLDIRFDGGNTQLDSIRVQKISV
jgi:hypothetical protein